MRYNSSAVINGHTAGGTRNYKYRMYVEGDTAFCIQPGVSLHSGDKLKESSSATWNALTSNQKKAVGLALLYGYQGNKSNLTGSDDKKWLATQTLVWEFVTGCRNATGSFARTSTDVYQLHFGSSYANSGAKAAYDQIVAMLKEHVTIPSFMSESKTGITKELSYSDGSKYTITLTDSEGVLSDYTFSSSNSKVSVSKSGNKLTICSTTAIDGSPRITATRNNVPTVIRIAAGSKDHINALGMVEGYGDGGNPVIDKSEFVLSLFEQLDRIPKVHISCFREGYNPHIHPG